jgi:single-strand DNA-binding protein
MINQAVLVGRICNEIELRYTTAGKPVATFTLAVERDFKNAQGEKDTDFLRCVVWGKLAEVVANNLDKGRLVGCVGRIQVRNYETSEGQKRQAFEIVVDTVQFLDRAKSDIPGVGADEY